jgi:hypothetical protein
VRRVVDNPISGVSVGSGGMIVAASVTIGWRPWD